MSTLPEPSPWVPAPPIAPLRGDEKFVGMNATVQDFWRFAMSDLRVNNTRGYLAEFMVARALGVNALRTEWDDYDVLWDGIKIEVKASAHLQVWAQRQLSQIRFTGLRAHSWGDIEAGMSPEKSYKADVYVLAAHTVLEHAAYDPLDVSAWSFFVLPQAQLVALNVDSLSLARVSGLTEAVGITELAAAVLTAHGRNANLVQR
ncbi:hypothetical protein [Microbacterium sp. PA5]|uniref:hypothetical protein n=1 Tax=Microbacterium sp. PA5 TaxID=3416654 RepID=UPI003CE7B4B1